MPKLIDLFPKGFTPEAHQIDILEKIDSALEKKKKFIILQAPTGSGKTFIARTIAGLSSKPSPTFEELISTYEAYKIYGDGGFAKEKECMDEPASGTFCLTITKSLQDQYNFTFNESKVLKGQSNYICKVDENFSVEIAPCTLVHKLKDQCWSENKCPYYNARNEALLSEFAVLNYKMFMALPHHVKHKNWIICDEASELEEELVKRFTAEINYDKLKAYGIEHNVLATDISENVLIWLNEIYDKVDQKIDEITEKLHRKKEDITPSEKNKLNYLKSLNAQNKVVIEHWRECEFVTEIDGKRAIMAPLRVNSLSRHIFDYADNVLLMSATIIDHQAFAKSLGIIDYEFVDIESIFDPNKSKIFISSEYPLNYKNRVTVLPKICKLAKKICDHHKDEKGIIHTHSMDITEIVRKKLGENERFLYRDDKANNEEILKIHCDNPTDPTILVSPSLTYGTDLKDYLARFQIIIKLMYPPLSSKRIKRLFELDPSWYTDKMLNALVQACGRATRSKDDWSTTYILDGNIKRVLLQNKHKLPKAFLARFADK